MNTRFIFYILFSILLIGLVTGAVYQYNKTIGGGDPSLVGYWKMDGNALDSSGNDKNGVVTNMAVINNGRFNEAYKSLVEPTSHIVVNDFFTNMSSNGTLSLWFKGTSSDANAYILSTGATSIHPISLINKNTRIYPYVCGTVVQTIIISETDWNYFTLSWEKINDTNVKTFVYYNGILSGVKDVISNCDFSILYIGNYKGSSSPMNGTIDEVRIYNRSLSSSEILELYNTSVRSYRYSLHGSPAKLTLDDDLVGYWKLDGNALDSSDNSNDGTVSGATITNDGKFNEAYEFDGTSTKVQTTNSITSWVNITPYTLSAWIKPTGAQSSGTTYTIMWADMASGSGYTAWFRIVGDYSLNGARLELVRSDGTNNPVAKSSDSVIQLNSGNWYHVIGMFNGTYMFLYLNGMLVNTTIDIITGSIFSDDLVIGNHFSGSYDKVFSGAIDEVRAYNRSLTDSEIQQLYNDSKYSPKFSIKGSPAKTDLDDGLIAYYKLDKNVNDSSGNGNDGVNIDSAIINDARFNEGYSMSDSYLSIPYLPEINSTNNWSFSGWIYVRDYGSVHAIIYENSGSTSDRNGLGIESVYKVLAGGTYSGTPPWRSVSSNNPINLDEWYHVVLISYSNFAKEMYLNGVKQTGSTASYVASCSRYGTLGAGCASTPLSSTYPFNGSIDEVRIYNRSLTESEVLELYNSSKSSFRWSLYGSPDKN